MLRSRSTEMEIMDLGPEHYTLDEYEDCLIKLDQIGRWLGGDRATFLALKEMDQSPQSILDVGCGGGLFTIRLAQRYPNAHVVGIDINPTAIDFAKKRLALLPSPPTNVSFEHQLKGPLEQNPKSYDVVLSTLVCHHLTDQEIVDYMLRADSIAKKKVIINDLHRHSMALLGFKAIGPIFGNRLVQNDGPLSICKGFTYGDWLRFLNMSEIPQSRCCIRRRWAYRWLIQINS